MKKRMLAATLSMSMILSASTALGALTAGDINYSSQLSQIEALMEQCDAKGISYDYETVNYNVIKKFESHLIEDIETGDKNVEYHKSVLDNLCTETIANLQSYLNGTKTPFDVQLPDYTDITIEGDKLVSGGKRVFSTGWGHGIYVGSAMQKFNNLGTGNVQIEIGPSQLEETDINAWDTYYGPALTKEGGFVSVENQTAKIVQTELDGGGNEYIGIYQNVFVKPNTTYTFTYKAKGKGNVIGFVNSWEYNQGMSSVNVNSDNWVTKSVSYTTAPGQYEVRILIFTDGVQTDGLYLDDLCLQEGNGSNLLFNGDFSNTVPKSMASIIPVINVLKKAEITNNAVSLLISPHYFPGALDDASTLIDPATGKAYTDLYGDAGLFNKYNINHPVAKETIENFLDTVLPYVSGYDALMNICLTNEPDFDTRTFSNYYNPLFRDYLKTVHGSDISGIKTAHGKTYSSWDKISMPSKLYKDSFITTSATTDPLVYDWIQFNDKLHADWHVWLKNIVKKHLPDVPVTAKPMYYLQTDFSSSSFEGYFSRGIDIELLDEAWDIAGNDCYDVPESSDTYYREMFYYDYLSSVTGKPVYNSEDHFSTDGDTTANEKYRAHVRRHFWQSAMHNLSMSTIWMWPRNYGIYMSGHRPDFMAETGRINLDITRLSGEIDSILSTDRKVALFYSKPSLTYDWNHSKKLFEAYKALINAGQRVGVVSENSLDQLDEYEVIILPGVSYGSDEALSALESYMDNGGKIMYSGSLMSKNEYRQSQTNTSVTGHSNATSYSDISTAVNALSPEIVIKDTSGNAVTGLDWSYYLDGKKAYISIMNLEYGTTKNLNVYINGEKISGMSELVSGTENVENIAAAGYEPQLLKATLVAEPTEPSVIIDKTVNFKSGMLGWEYTFGIYNGANIYRLTNYGVYKLVATVTEDTYWSYTLPGIYAIKAVGDDSEITDDDLLYAGISGAFTVSSDVTKSGNAVNGSVIVKNETECPIKGVVKVEILDGEGNVIRYHYQTITLKGKRSDSFTISVPADKNAAKVKVYAVDTKTDGNVISNEITKQF